MTTAGGNDVTDRRRWLGEPAMHRPTSGSFVSYAREFLGENWATTGIVDIIAGVLHVR